MKLEQRRGGYKRSFELNNNTLKVVYNNILSTNEWSIDLENIGHVKEVKSYSRVGIKIVGTFSLLLAFLLIFVTIIYDWSDDEIINSIVSTFFLTTFSIICFKVPFDDNLTLKGDVRDLKFFLNHPSRKNVEEFTDELIKKSKEIILKKYSRIDPDISEEEFFRQINWLLQNNYLTEEEYEEKKSEYKISKMKNYSYLYLN